MGKTKTQTTTMKSFTQRLREKPLFDVAKKVLLEYLDSNNTLFKDYDMASSKERKEMIETCILISKKSTELMMKKNRIPKAQFDKYFEDACIIFWLNY